MTPAPHRLLIIGALAACAPSAPGSSPAPTTPMVAIDGEWRDWASVEPRWTGLRAAALPHAPVALRLRHDDSALFLHLTVADTINLQTMPGTLRLALDADGRAETGESVDEVPGTDLIIEHSYRAPNGSWQGVRAKTLPGGEWRDSYGAGMGYAPTVADRQFEIRLARRPSEGPPLGGRIALQWSALDTGGVVRARTEAVRASLGPAPSRITRADPAALARRPGTVRVVTWNVGDDGLLQAPDGFRRTLTAIAPDVVLFDELNPAVTVEHLHQVLPGPRPWTIRLGTAGGRQRTAVASLHPIEPHPAMARVDYPDSLQQLLRLPMSRQMESDVRGAPADGVPTMGAVVEALGQRILMVPVDLICCGGATGAPERARRMTAVAIRDAIERAMAVGPVDAVVVGGDLNLVGSRRPLEILRAGLDPVDGRDLEVALAQRLDGASNATWLAPSPFPPGRLDYLLVSPSRLSIVRSFTLHPDDFTPAARTALRLDPAAQTDHLPIVADLATSPRVPR